MIRALFFLQHHNKVFLFFVLPRVNRDDKIDMYDIH